jgi:AhpD family alkylhydroperoxidase
MARVELKKNTVTRMIDWYVRRSYGKPIEVTGVIAHRPWELIGYSTLEFGHERSHAVEARLKALGEMKAATLAGCQFCIDIGSALSRKAGVTEEQLRDFNNYTESDAFSPVEKLVLEYAEAMTRTPVDVSDELHARMKEHFSDAQIVELSAGIAIENFRARFNYALDITPAGFSEGMYCPLPEHAAKAAEGNGAQPERTIA